MYLAVSSRQQPGCWTCYERMIEGVWDLDTGRISIGCKPRTCDMTSRESLVEKNSVQSLAWAVTFVNEQKE